MKQIEMDLIAKAIRNSTLSLGYKTEIVNNISSALFHENQFFNHVRFKGMALQHLPPGWPNHMGP